MEIPSMAIKISGIGFGYDVAAMKVVAEEKGITVSEMPRDIILTVLRDMQSKYNKSRNVVNEDEFINWAKQLGVKMEEEDKSTI